MESRDCMNLIIKEFEDLTIDELYQILKLRNLIFIVEQECPYEDIDGIDRNSIHLFQKQDNEIVSYLRIILKDKYAIIGRVLVKESYRRKNLGKEILQKGIEYTFNNFDYDEINIEAQEYLRDLYASLGFKVTSDIFILDNIAHIEMKLKRQEWLDEQL